MTTAGKIFFQVTVNLVNMKFEKIVKTFSAFSGFFLSFCCGDSVRDWGQFYIEGGD